MGRIRPLPPEAVSQIQSSKNILDLETVVFSLVENSLDAGASRIEVSVDFQRGSCVVEDNGHGIHRSEFEQQGGLGKLHHTSKHDTAGRYETHGSTGSFLASLAMLSFLEINSCPRSSSEHATLIMHHGKVVKRMDFVTAPRAMSIHFVHGTCVAVRDLFGNLPVRSLQRYLGMEPGNIHEKSWLALKRGIVSLLLAWITPCTIRISDLHNKARNIQLTGARSSLLWAPTTADTRESTGCSTKLDFNNILAILHQSSLAPRTSCHRWIPVFTSTTTLSVEGFINLDPAPSKKCQFISIGIHPCSPSHGHDTMYDDINTVFANSKFGRTAHDDKAIDENAKRGPMARDQVGVKPEKSGPNTRKATDKWPMFVFQVRLAGEWHYPKLIVPGDNLLNSVNDILSTTVREWLCTNKLSRRRVLSGIGAKSVVSPGISQPVKANKSGADRNLTPQRYEVYPQKRASTADNVLPPKRTRLHYDGSSVDTRPKIPQTAPAQSVHFCQASRIKSSHGSFYDTISREKKSIDRGSGRGDQSNISGMSPFSLPTLEVAGLSKRSLVTSTRNKYPNNTLGAKVGSCGIEPLQDSMAEAKLSKPDPVKPDEGNVVDNLQDDSSALAVHTAEDTNADAVIEWVDPTTKQTVQVNNRTGTILPMRPRSENAMSQESRINAPFRQTVAIDAMKTSAGRPVSMSRRSTFTNARPSSGEMPVFLREWTNPVFVLPNEEQIPVASRTDIQLGVDQSAEDCCAADIQARDSGEALNQRLTKDMLRHVQVIKQVDRKFILCKTQCDSSNIKGSLLFLVDQHAASERVILEQLMAQLCLPEKSDGTVFRANGLLVPGINAVKLDRPIRFEINAMECDLLVKHAQHLANWGILYKVPNRDHDVASHSLRQHHQSCVVTVHALPPGISERCTQAPELLIDLLRSESWLLEEYRYTNNTALGICEDSGPNNQWVARSRTCPKQMLDLLNSRACRSAIMFNDELSIDECRDLIAQVSDCAFPFVCAHGRNSMVPVVTIPGCAGQTGGPVPGVGLHEAERTNHFTCGHC